MNLTLNTIFPREAADSWEIFFGSPFHRAAVPMYNLSSSAHYSYFSNYKKKKKYFGNGSATTYSLHEYLPLCMPVVFSNSSWIWALILCFKWASLPLRYITLFSSFTKHGVTQCPAPRYRNILQWPKQSPWHIGCWISLAIPGGISSQNIAGRQRGSVHVMHEHCCSPAHHSCTVFLAVCHCASFCAMKICCTCYNGAFILLKKKKNH